MENTDLFHELDRMLKDGKLKEAEKYLTSAMELALRETDLPALLAISNELGGIFRVTGRFGEAKKVYNAAMKIIRQLGLENTEQHGTTLLNLASVYTEMDDAEEALKLDIEAETIFKMTGSDQDYRLAALYNNMSHAFEKTGRIQEALEHAEKSLMLIKKLKGSDTELATSYTTLAARCSKAGKLDEAAGYLAEAERIFLSIPGKPDVHFAAALNALGEVSFKTGKQQDAICYFKQSLQILKDNYGENQAFHEVAGNLEKALLLQRKTDGDDVQAAAAAVVCHEGGRISGLALSEAYYHQYGRSMIEESFSAYKRYMAVGLVGEGSDCLGFDDDLSESHDFGPGFCIWLPDEVYQNIGWKLREAYEKLPRTYQNKRRIETAEGHDRVGVFSIGEFYRRYTGCKDVPGAPVEWLLAPETSFATVTSGKVFEDHLGEFTRIRQGILDFYPRDVLLKKLAARMAMMSQTGQYNYERIMKRNDYASAYLACSEFVRNAVSMIYLLNGRYMPFYKWVFRGMDQLKILSDMKPMLGKLAALPDLPEHTEEKAGIIEDICIEIRDELKSRGMIRGDDAFLNSHCGQVMSQITDQKIRSLPVMFDAK